MRCYSIDPDWRDIRCTKCTRDAVETRDTSKVMLSLRVGQLARDLTERVLWPSVRYNIGGRLSMFTSLCYTRSCAEVHP